MKHKKQRPEYISREKHKFFLGPCDQATRTRQPKREATSMHTCLCLNRLMLIGLPAARTAAILLENPLVAEKAEPESAQAWQKARVREIQIFIAYRT